MDFALRSPQSRQPTSGTQLSSLLLSQCVAPIGVYMPTLGAVNGAIRGRGQRSLTVSGATTAPNRAGLGWVMGGSNYVEVGPLQATLPRTTTESNSFTVIAVVECTAAASFGMILSAFGGGTNGALELRLNASTGRPQINVDTIGGDSNASTASSIVGVGPVAIVATFRGSASGASTPSRRAIWCRNEFAEASVGDGVMDWGLNNPARIGVRGGGTTLPWSGSINAVILLAGAISDATAAEIAQSPAAVWRMCFAPRVQRIWAPAAGGGDASTAIAGVAGAAAVGALAATGGAQAALLGVAGSAAAGALTAAGAAAAALTGATAAPAAGQVTASASGSASVALQGAAAAPGVGSLQATAGAQAVLVGVAAAPAAGTVNATAAGASSITLTGAAASPSVGQLSSTGSVQIVLSGAAAVPAVGVVAVSTALIAMSASRTLRILAERRVLSIAEEARALRIAAENRTLRVPK